jgi:hypothetical protein
MNNELTVSLSDTFTQTITSLSPLLLTIDPSSMVTDNLVYKLSFDFGDGISYDQVLTIENTPKSFKQTHSYSLSTIAPQTYNIVIKAYEFNSSVPIEYVINLSLSNAPLETKIDGDSSPFDKVHLVGSRMFGVNNDIIYMFESENPNYILPVMVNWSQKPAAPPAIFAPSDIRPFKLLQPFENESVASIDTVGHIINQEPPPPPPDYYPPLTDHGSPDIILTTP